MTPGRNGHPWASLRASHPVITDHARQRRGPVQDTDRSHVFDIASNLPSTKLLKTCDVVSHRLAADEDAANAVVSLHDVVPSAVLDGQPAAGYSPEMLVWVASFPRSGNTFLRIILHCLYGIRTSTVYDVDGVAERLGKDLIGFADRPGSLAEVRASDEPHFIKTHRQRDADVDENDSAICLVRDGRDALVSWAHQASEEDPGGYEAELRKHILRVGAVGTGSWGNNILSWLRPPAPHRIVLQYEDLIRDPRAAVTPIIAALTPALAVRPNAAIPSLDELRRHDDRFFRRGHTGSHRDELPADLHQLFWSRADNQVAMTLLGYPKPDAEG